MALHKTRRSNDDPEYDLAVADERAGRMLALIDAHEDEALADAYSDVRQEWLIDGFESDGWRDFIRHVDARAAAYAKRGGDG
jgi:hypothetical protein